MTDPGIYCWICVPTGDLYVGATTGPIHERCKKHRYALRRGKHTNPHLQNAWNKHGEEAFLYSVLEYVFGDAVWQAEIDWCTALKPRYNIASPGQVPMKGRRHSEDTKARLREATTMQFSTEEARQRQAELSRGRTQTEEKKRKVSAFHTGRKRPTETGQRISASLKGRQLSADTCQKIRETRRRHACICIDDSGRETRYPSVTEAARELFPANDSARAHIRACCKGKTKSAYGLRWRYADS